MENINAYAYRVYYGISEEGFHRTVEFLFLTEDKGKYIDEEKWLSSDDFNFSHDFYGIIKNVKRDSYPPKDFGLFVPRFARIKEEHKA